MDPALFSGSANAPLAEAIARELGGTLGRTLLERFPDRELHVEIFEDVGGRDVFVIQPLSPPAELHLLELLLLADTAKRGGARSITAVIPYLAYARQDHRRTMREPLSAALIADLIGCSGVGRVVVVDLHTPCVEGFFGVPVEHLSALPLLADELRRSVQGPAVVVSPDLGGAKRAEACAALLHLPVVLVHKNRVSGGEVEVRGIAGDLRGCAPIIVDDMISTGGTVEAAIKALGEAGCSSEVTVAATHGLLVEDAPDRLGRLPIRQIVTTDTVRSTRDPPLPLRRIAVAPLIAVALRRFAASP